MMQNPRHVVLRQLTADDAAAFRTLRLYALRDAPTAFGASLSEEASRSVDDIAHRLAAVVDGSRYVVGAFAPALVGMAGFFRESTPKTSHIGTVWGVFVSPPCRRRGLAQQLVSRVVAHAETLPGLRQLQLRVGTHNVAARALYESFGFRQVGVIPEALCVGAQFYDEAILIRQVGAGS